MIWEIIRFAIFWPVESRESVNYSRYCNNICVRGGCSYLNKIIAESQIETLQ